MPTATSQGTAHYKLKAKAPKLDITADDERILFDLYRHAIVDSHTIRQVLSHRSPDWLGKRLRALMDAGYINKPREQRRIRVPDGGSLPHAYTLGNKGARLLRERHELPVRTDRWKTTSDDLSPFFIEHTLDVARLTIALRTSVERRDDIMGFEYPDQIYARLRPALLRKKRLPAVFRSPVDWHGWREREATIPDGFCALRYREAPPEKSSRYLFIELDRGTETIEPAGANLKNRKFFLGNSVLRKFVIYGQGFAAGAHTEIFGIPTFQVLTVTTNAERVHRMIETIQRHLAAAPHRVSPIRFLFTNRETVAEFDGDLLAVPFLDGAGKERSLVPDSDAPWRQNASTA